ncbi:MAG TPA: HU family DNA-binding protein [Burkholderiaceae bacterium]|nr:HU family DNA-binding protein [Burkholderiaceae bacterium]
MATTKKTATSAPEAREGSAKKSGSAPRAPRAAAGTTRGASDVRPVKNTFTKASLVAHVAEQSGLEPRNVKAVLAALEASMLGAVHKKGVGEFTLSGLVKITAQRVPAKKRRFGKDPFTGEDRWFDAKPASVRVKVRALKKLKDAAA